MDEPIEDRPPPEEQDVDEDSEEYEDDEDEELVPTFDALNKSAATPVTIGVRLPRLSQSALVRGSQHCTGALPKGRGWHH